MSKPGAAGRRGTTNRAGRLGPWRTALLCVGGAVALVTGLFALAATEVGATGGTAPTVGWTGATAPLPAQPAPSANAEPLVFDESCVTAVFCAQTGDYDTSSNTGTYLSVLSGSTWTATPVPLPAGSGGGVLGSIDSLTCPAVQFCIGVGASGVPSSSVQAPLAVTYANGKWTATAITLPAGAATSNQGAELLDVSCQSPTSCVAVGSYNTASGTPQFGLVATLAGTTWSATQAPQPADATTNQNVSLAAVSCAPSSCAAVGEYTPSASVNATTSEVLTSSNGAWSAQTPTLPSDTATGASLNAFLSGVSCSAGQCEAGGGYTDTAGVSQGLLAHIVGPTVTTIQAPQPTGHATGSHEGVNLGAGFPNYISCTFTGTCTAVGSYVDGSNVAQGLIESVSNGAPAATEAPLPTGANATGTALSGAACLSATACTVSGSFDSVAGVQPLIEQLSGTTWTATKAPLPAGDTLGELNAVACSSRGACRVAGFAGTGTGTPTASTLYDGSYTPAEGYWLSGSDGGIFNYGSAQFHGSAGALKLNAPVVGMAATPGDGGYWEVASDGGIFNYGDAPFYGSAGSLHLVKPVVGMASTPDGGGYWLVASDGGIFSYGDANFYGSMGGKPLNQPIVGLAATPDGGGYWEVASDGGIFSFGDASFYGSMGGKPLNRPVVGIAADGSGLGYWEVASDGGIFSYGDAAFYGSTGSIVLNKPVVGVMSSFDGAGYWLVATDGGIFNYGDAGFSGSTGSLRLNAPVVGGAPS